METTLTPLQHFLFVNLTSIIAVLGGLSLWAGFIVLGLVARRFEQAYDVVTHWQFLVGFPAGVFIYLLMQALASWRHQNMGALELWMGYAFMIVSAAMCLWGAYRFWKIVGYLSRRHD